jgi:ribose 5-phosphate isomerase B
MRIAIAADHAGFVLKEGLRHKLLDDGHEVVDFGTDSAQSCDYPDFAQAVAREVAQGRCERGILVCSTGIGMAIAANKVAGARAAPAECNEEVRLTREHNDANILTLGARFVSEQRAAEMIDIFLKTEFLGGRHLRRLAKIARLEEAGPAPRGAIGGPVPGPEGSSSIEAVRRME